jgi:murein DD-endopeptidase MepM/ murein hydrolase activator NlpD
MSSCTGCLRSASRCRFARRVVARYMAAGPMPAMAHPPASASASAPQMRDVLSIGCTVAGPSEFVDRLGAPRSGGPRHQGVDMTADRGMPVVAALSGFAEFKRSNAGGSAVWLTTFDGDKFYYAHLDAWEGSSRDVSIGEVIGYVGSTGYASGPHLHFEVHPGESPVNPFPFADSACDTATPDFLSVW